MALGECALALCTDMFSVIICVQILLFELHGGSTRLGGVHVREGVGMEGGWGCGGGG